MTNQELVELLNRISEVHNNVDINSALLKHQEFILETREAEIKYSVYNDSQFKNEGQRSSQAKIKLSQDSAYLKMRDEHRRIQADFNRDYRELKLLERKFRIYRPR